MFGPSIEAIFGDRSPVDALSAYADLDEYALLHQAALWARGEAVAARPSAGDGTVSAAVADAWRGILLRRPRWRADAEERAEYEPDGYPTALVDSLGAPEPGRVAIDLAIVDARPADATETDSLLAIEGQDGRLAPPLSRSLARLPAYSLIARRYVRTDG